MPRAPSLSRAACAKKFGTGYRSIQLTEERGTNRTLALQGVISSLAEFVDRSSRQSGVAASWQQTKFISVVTHRSVRIASAGASRGIRCTAADFRFARESLRLPLAVH